MNSACVLFFVAGIIMLVFGMNRPAKQKQAPIGCLFFYAYSTLPPGGASCVEFGGVDGMIRDLGRRDTQVL